MSTHRPADIVFKSGKIVTLDDASSIVEAIAIAGDRIVAVGSDGEIERHEAPETVVVDLAGRCVIPGLIDAHAHLDREGLKDVFPSLAGARSIDDILQRVSDLAKAAGKGEWVVTMPIGEPPFYDDPTALIAEGRYPTREDLDRAAPDNPVYIRPIWGYWRGGHGDRLVSIANTRALELAGIGSATPPPSPAVEIEIDPTTGAPTGRFFESTPAPVMELTLLGMVPGFTREDRVGGLERSLRAYNAAGTTGIFEGHGVAGEVVSAYQSLAATDRLSVRARLVHSPAWHALGAVDRGRLLQSWAGWLGHGGVGDDWLRVEGLYAELGPSPDNLARARAMPYTGWSGFYYDCGLPREDQVTLLTEAARLGIRPSTISIAFLDIYEEVNRAIPIRDRRWIIQHVGHLTRDQISRIRDLGIVMSPLPIQNIYNRRASGGAGAPPPGPDALCMPVKSLLSAGVNFGLVTDNILVSLFTAIWNAVARRDKFGELVDPEDEKLTRIEALRAATRGGAYFTFEEGRRGVIAPGALADLAVLTDDPLTCPEAAIRDIAADETYVGGRLVYRRGAA